MQVPVRPFLVELDEAVSRVHYRCYVHDRPIPITRHEAVQYIAWTIQMGSAHQELDYQDELYLAIKAKLIRLFPEWNDEVSSSGDQNNRA
jgi:hypothetical protein